MKLKLLYLFLVLIVSFISISFISDNDVSVNAKDPKIVFDKLSHNFGKVEQGQTLKHIFKFTNEGDGVLIINSVKASCGCTGIIMSEKKEFQHGEEGEIKVTFNTHGRAGVNQKSVTVTTNDTNNMTIVLTFKCEIQH